MKKYLLLSTLILGIFQYGISQTKDNVARECVLFELFTGVRCPYCPAAANGVAQLLEEGKPIAPVAYHTSAFSNPEYYTTETNARASFYGINSYPTLKTDGMLTYANGGNASQTNYAPFLNQYNQRISQTSPFTIDLSYESVEGSTCRVNCVVTQVGECSGTNVRVFIALTQCNINVSWQGMTGLHHVCRDMIPNQAGTTFVGPTMTISETFEMNWPKEDCYLTAWVQNYTGSREVYQTVRMSTALDLDYDLVLENVSEVVSSNCSGIQGPRFTVKNFGNQEVTSFDMCVNDGQEDHIQTWHGNLEPGETTTVKMDDFEGAPCDVLHLNVAMPNGHQDQFMADNYAEVEMEEVRTIDGFIKLQIKTDGNPEETVVQVENMETGEVVQTFTFDIPRHTYREEFVLLNAGCYRLSVLDSGGDGLGSGSLFAFQDAEGESFFKGGGAVSHFEYRIDCEVYCDGTLNVPEQTVDKCVVLPNPSNGAFYLDLDAGLWQVTICDLSGRLIYQNNSYTVGMISIEGCESGMYVLKATNGTKEVVRKVMVY